MPKGNVSKGMRRGRKMMERNKGRFLRNDPHAYDKVKTRNSGNENPVMLTQILSSIDNERDKNAVILIDKMIKDNRYRYGETAKKNNDLITRLVEQNLHIPYVRMIHEFEGSNF